MSRSPTELARVTDPREDGELVARARRGDPAAGERLVLRLRCVARMLAAKNAAIGRPLRGAELEDVAQEVLALLWKDLERFNGTSKLETWAYGYCVRVLYGAVRARARGDQHLERLAREPAVPADAGVEAELEDHAHVHGCLAHLPQDEREIVELRHFAELSFDDAAARLGLSPNTAKTRYYRGLSKLRRCLSRFTGRR